MAIFKKRLPSLQETALAFAACVFPVYSWSIFQFLDRLPAWLYYLNSWEIISMFAYTQMFALLESLLVLLVVVSMAVIAPNRFTRDKFVALSSTGVLLTSVWLMFVHYNEEIEILRQAPMPVWMARATALGTIATTWGLIFRFAGFKKFVDSVADRLSVFLYIYIPVSLISIPVVIVRNLHW